MSAALIIDFQGILAEVGSAAKQRALSDMQKAANQVVAELWEARYLPKHFEEYAARRYQYAARAVSTIRKKERMASRNLAKYGGKRSLVMKGLLEEQMARRGVLRAYPTRLTLRKPSHVPRKPRNSQIDLHAEVTKVIPEETRYLMKAAKEEFLAKLKAYRPRRSSGRTA